MERFTKKGGLDFTDKNLSLRDEWGYSYIYNRLAELEDKLESGQLVELPKPFIGYGENAYGETTYLVYRSKVETYCPSEDVYTDKSQAKSRLKELQQ